MCISTYSKIMHFHNKTCVIMLYTLDIFLLNYVFHFNDTYALWQTIPPKLSLLESYMYSMLQMLLEDPVPGVRSQAVLGVFRIMSLFWELMPSVTIKNIVTKVIQDLAFDSSSADVRESVVKVRGQHKQRRQNINRELWLCSCHARIHWFSLPIQFSCNS